MAIERPPFKNAVQERLYDILDECAIELEASTLEHDFDGGGVTGIERDELTYVSEAMRLVNEVDQVVRTVVAHARVADFTWTEIARAAGLKSAQVAFNRWGHDVDTREAVAEVVGEPPKPAKAKKKRAELPGLSAAEAGRQLGVDPRTVQAMGERGELKTVIARQLSGRKLTRYILEGSEQA